MKTKPNVKTGSICTNRNEPQVRVAATGLKVKTNVKAGAISPLRLGGGRAGGLGAATDEGGCMDIVRELDDRVARVLTATEALEAYRITLDPEADVELVERIIRNILYEVYFYGSHIVESAFVAIGRFPKNKPQLMRPLVEHLLDEVYHPELAMQDYARMGGDASAVGSRRMSPAALAVAAICRFLANHESPFTYMGFVYLLESTTPILTERLTRLSEARKIGAGAKFIPLHAKADVEHEELIKDQICRVVALDPDAGPAILYGFDCLATAWPLPIWTTALERARAEAARQAG